MYSWTIGQCHVALCVAKSRGNTHPQCIGPHECPVAGDSSSTLGFRKVPKHCVRRAPLIIKIEKRVDLEPENGHQVFGCWPSST